MGKRTNYSIVKGVPADQANDVVTQASAEVVVGPQPRGYKWADWTYVVQPNDYTALSTNGALVLFDDAHKIADIIADKFDAPHLELRFQEGDHWDFTLFYRRQVIADFSTAVGYFDESADTPRPWKEGSASAFSKVWGVSLDHIEPYLIDWAAGAIDPYEDEDFEWVQRRVFPDDTYTTGDCYQLFDFMNALGLPIPDGHPDCFEFSAPAWEDKFMRQPWWRRAIRRVCEVTTGDYPDRWIIKRRLRKQHDGR